MQENHAEKPLKPGDRAPNVVLDAITRQGKIAIDDFRGQKPVLVGLFRGLHCPFCRRQIAAMAELTDALQEKGIDSLTVVNTPIDRARLYFRYHPLPNLLAASDPERVSHRGLRPAEPSVHGKRERLAAQSQHEHCVLDADRHAGRASGAHGRDGGGGISRQGGWL